MASNQMLGAISLVGAMVLAGIAGCGGSRNSSDGEPPAPEDFALGAGDVNAQWSSSSMELVHNLSRGALYYLDVENQDVVAIDVASGDDSILVSLPIGPAKMRLTADNQDIYILESDISADATGGFPDLIRYNISGNFIGSPFIELDSELRVDDFVATNNEQVVVAGYQASGTEIYFSLFNANGGFLDEEIFNGTGFVVQQLALAADQQTVLSSLVRNSNSVLNTISIAGNTVSMTGSVNLTLAQTAVNTYEPEGGRVFRSNGAVWDGDEEKSLGSSYESIDFDLNDDRIVILVRGGSGFIVRYFDLDSLEVLSEQALPAVEEATGMEPVKLFVDDSDLYVVYREITSAPTKDHVLVEFNYP